MTAPAEPAPPPAAPRRLRWWLALPFAMLGGLGLDAATPWLAWWPAALVGAALILVALWQQRARAGLGLGAAAGAAFWLPNIHWLTLYLGPVPWLGLAGVMIAWFALLGLAVAVATRGIARLPIPAWARVAAQAVAAAGLWVLREQLQSTWPYGGFAWGRIAHTQAEGPLAALVSWLGFPGLSGILVFACALPVAAWFARGGGAARRPLAPILVSAATVLALVLLALAPPAPLARSGDLRVAAVQGNSKSGIFDDRENGDVFRSHLEETGRMLDELEARGERVDVIVWPENSAEFDLPGHRDRMSAVQRLAERAGAPIVLGTILAEPGDDEDGDGERDIVYTNSTLVVSGDASTPTIIEGRYDKRRPVPFAEYMPNRPFFRALAPDLVDLVQLEYTAGTLPAVLEVDGAAGPFRAGIAICFDIVFDDHADAMMTQQPATDGEAGAQVIFAQTNNADFGRTDQSAQQLQIARLRAVETGRALVNISTVGTSAIVAPDGADLAAIEPHTVGFMVAEVPLVDGLTPASRFGGWIAAAWMLLGGAGLLVGLYGSIRSRAPRG